MNRLAAWYSGSRWSPAHMAMLEVRGRVRREYVRVATSGRHHFPVPVGAPLSEFASIAERYPVYRIDPPGTAPN